MESREIVEDARGLLCPLPVIRLGERIRTVAPGDRVLLLADDPMAEEDVRMWAAGAGHHLEGVEREGRVLRLSVRKGGEDDGNRRETAEQR
jgi:tRNA 2-thiouridine synthesizing protein A